jgi:hypothetical protein
MQGNTRQERLLNDARQCMERRPSRVCAAYVYVTEAREVGPLPDGWELLAERVEAEYAAREQRHAA